MTLVLFLWGNGDKLNSPSTPGRSILYAFHYPVTKTGLREAGAFDRFPGRSRGYSTQPEEVRAQFARDIPLWREFIRHEAERCSCPYIEMSDNFQSRLIEAETHLTTGIFPAEH